jgi:aminoglycoside 3-N-acetyltransferase
MAIYQHEIVKILAGAGLRTGDSILVHSSLRNIGEIVGGGDSLIDAFLEVVGNAGTLAMPTFNYTFGIPHPYFDPVNTPGKTGVLTEIVRTRAKTMRSLSPTHSVAAQGKKAGEYLEDHLAVESLGTGSPIDKIALDGGYVLLLGVSHTSNSTIHIGESHANVKKFFYKEGLLPVAKVLTPNGEVIEHTIDCSGSCSRTFNSIEYWLRKKKQVVDLSIGAEISYLMKGIDIINTTVEMIREQQDVFFCQKKSCRRCVLGREYLQRR